MPYVRLDCGILDSTLWFQKTCRDIFITALLMARPHEAREPIKVLKVDALESDGWEVPRGWYGIVEAAGPGIVRRAGVDDLDEGMAALQKLCSPEAESRSQRWDGRRMARIDGGYIVLNFDRYRTKDHTAAERAQRHRDKKRREASRSVTAATPLWRDEPSRVTEKPSRVTQAEAEADLNTDMFESAELTSNDDVQAALNLGDEARASRKPNSNTPVAEIWKHWLGWWRKVRGSGAAPKLDDKRRKKIQARLREGFTVEQLKQAADGCWTRQHNLEHGYLDAELVYRNAGKVEMYCGFAQGPPRPKAEDFAGPSNAEILRQARGTK